MDDIEAKLNQMADNADGINPIELWMKKVFA